MGLVPQPSLHQLCICPQVPGFSSPCAASCILQSNSPPLHRFNQSFNHCHHHRGDHKLRSTYGERMLQLMSQLGCAAPGQVGKVLDMGCATGLSSLALRELFPAAHITGVDLSPHFLAVADYEQQKR